MIDRTHLRNFLNSIPGLEGWSDSVEHLNGVEMVIEALREVTPKMYTAGEIAANEGRAAQHIYKAMWSARFRGE